MGLNCKPGDLALIVRSVAGNQGKIVRCAKIVGSWHALDGAGPRWETDPPVNGLKGEHAYPVLDCNMRPIRDSDRPDEMLRIAGRQEHESACRAS